VSQPGICNLQIRKAYQGWFSTYKENGAQKLAAIIADVTEEQPDAVPSDPARLDGAERPSLNDRQMAVLRLVFEGLRNNEIESRLDMTPSAVKNTLQQLFSKAGVNKRSRWRWTAGLP
jgi:DNA-binding NarL/FixJ family response regulator